MLIGDPGGNVWARARGPSPEPDCRRRPPPIVESVAWLLDHQADGPQAGAAGDGEVAQRVGVDGIPGDGCERNVVSAALHAYVIGGQVDRSTSARNRRRPAQPTAC